MKELNSSLDDKTLFLYLVRIPKKCMNWMLLKKVSIEKLISVEAESKAGNGSRNGLQLLYDDEVILVESLIKASPNNTSCCF